MIKEEPNVIPGRKMGRFPQKLSYFSILQYNLLNVGHSLERRRGGTMALKARCLNDEQIQRGAYLNACQYLSGQFSQALHFLSWSTAM